MDLPQYRKYGAQHIGYSLKAMGFKKRKNSAGTMAIEYDEHKMKLLTERYDISSPLQLEDMSCIHSE
jgi:hypothetical protein